MWSRWQDIEYAKTEQCGCYGIYQIRMVDEIGNPFPIPRTTGIDEEGVIYIGRALPKNTLAKRIYEFETNSKLGKASHSGGETYVLMWLKLKCSGHAYKNHKLQYRVMRLDIDATKPETNRREELKHKINSEEINALVDYFNRYCELPPCNSNFPGKWNRFADKLQELCVRSKQQ